MFITPAQISLSVGGGIGSAVTIILLALIWQRHASRKKVVGAEGIAGIAGEAIGPTKSPKKRKVGMALLIVGIIMSIMFIPLGFILMGSIDIYGNPAIPEGFFAMSLGLVPLILGIVVLKKNPKFVLNTSSPEKI